MTLFTRLIFWFVGLNALAGAGSLILFPGQTEQLFFWPVTPPINAALFGALYLTGGSAVCFVTLRGEWERARLFVPVLVAAGVLISGVSLIHIDRLSTGLRLGYWLIVYMGAPLLALAIYVRQEGRGANWAISEPLLPATRWIATGVGVLVLAAGSAFIIAPEPAVAAWPWPTTPLMTRIFAAWFSAFGAGLLWFQVDRDWSRLALLATLLIAAALLDLAMLLIHLGDVNNSGAPLWIYCAHLVGLALTGGLMHWLQWPGRRKANSQQRQSLAESGY